MEYRYKGMKAIFLENELLRVGVLADKRLPWLCPGRCGWGP